MLEACRYVDEVVKIPPNFGGTKEAWKMYGFDVQFSGSDYEDDPGWLGDKGIPRRGAWFDDGILPIF